MAQTSADLSGSHVGGIVSAEIKADFGGGIREEQFKADHSSSNEPETEFKVLLEKLVTGIDVSLSVNTDACGGAASDKTIADDGDIALVVTVATAIIESEEVEFGDVDFPSE